MFGLMGFSLIRTNVSGNPKVRQRFQCNFWVMTALVSALLMLWRVLKPHDTNDTLSIVVTSYRWDTDGQQLSPSLENLLVIRRDTTRGRKWNSAFLLDPWVPLLATK